MSKTAFLIEWVISTVAITVMKFADFIETASEIRVRCKIKELYLLTIVLIKTNMNKNVYS